MLTCLVPPLFVVVIGLTDWLSGLIVLVTMPLVPLFMVLVGLDHRAADGAVARRSSGCLTTSSTWSTAWPRCASSGGRRAQQRALSPRSPTEYRRETHECCGSRSSPPSCSSWPRASRWRWSPCRSGCGCSPVSSASSPRLLVLLLAPEVYLPLRQLGANHHAAAEGVASAELLDILETPVPVRVSRPVSSDLIVTSLEVRDPGRAVILPPTSFRAVRVRSPPWSDRVVRESRRCCRCCSDSPPTTEAR